MQVHFYRKKLMKDHSESFFKCSILIYPQTLNIKWNSGSLLHALQKQIEAKKGLMRWSVNLKTNISNSKIVANSFAFFFHIF